MRQYEYGGRPLDYRAAWVQASSRFPAALPVQKASRPTIAFTFHSKEVPAARACPERGILQSGLHPTTRVVQQADNGCGHQQNLGIDALISCRFRIAPLHSIVQCT